jgi:hypothetical protein
MHILQADDASQGDEDEDELTIQAVNSSTSVTARERVGEEARMASTQVQLAERAAAVARSRYVCRSDMAPAAAPRQARSAELGPGGSAAPAAMPISETTTSWFVMCGSSNGRGSRLVERDAATERNAAHLDGRDEQIASGLGECVASRSLRGGWRRRGRGVATYNPSCGARWACHVGFQVEPTCGPEWPPAGELRSCEYAVAALVHPCQPVSTIFIFLPFFYTRKLFNSAL